MSKSGQSILRGARQALAYAQGARDGFVAHVPEEVDVVAIRKRLGLSQDDFAARFGFKLDALQNWEQGRRRPDLAARAFLRVIEREPALCAGHLPKHRCKCGLNAQELDRGRERKMSLCLSPPWTPISLRLERAAMLIAREQCGFEPDDIMEMFKHALFMHEFERKEIAVPGTKTRTL